MPRLAARAVELRIACVVSHRGAGAQRAAINTVRNNWTRGGTNVSLGRFNRQGGRWNLAKPLDPDGWLARFASQPTM